MKRVAVAAGVLCAVLVAAWLAWPVASEDRPGRTAPSPWPDGDAMEPPMSCARRPAAPAYSRPPPWAKVTREQMDEAARLRVPAAFENHLGMRFVFVPAGAFAMGSPADERGRGGDEALHEVVLTRPFYVQSTEVTNAQLRRCDVWRVGRDHTSGTFRGHSLDGDRHPAVQVSWETASEFARWLSREDGFRRYALPTEAQWEHACRAGQQARFWWGTSPDDGPRRANVNDVRTAAWLRLEWDRWTRDDGHRLTAPVASYEPNRWGLYDMAGNVWEWCADWYGPYPTERLVDPLGPGEGRARVLRGGSWLFGPSQARSAARRRDGPGARSMNVGFRLVTPICRVR